MTKNATIDNSANGSELTMLQTKLDWLSQRLDELHSDLKLIKDIFLKKQAKKQRRQEKKEQERLEIERQENEKEDRSNYEQIIRQVVHRPWALCPAPDSGVTEKELELLSILVPDQTDRKIALKMNIKEQSVSPRICALNKKLRLNSREDLISYYQNYRKIFRDHRHQRCLWLLSWLLDPPPGIQYRRKLTLTWRRKFGRGSNFHHAGPYIPPNVFDDLCHYEHAALKLRMAGCDNKAIAKQLKIKETTVSSYFARFRGHIKLYAGVSIRSEEELMRVYKEHLKLVRLLDKQVK